MKLRSARDSRPAPKSAEVLLSIGGAGVAACACFPGEKPELTGEVVLEVAASFQQNSPAFFTWLGVVPYLTQDAIGRTLDYMSSIQDSQVVFDYMEPPEAFSEELRQLETKRTEQLEKINERSLSRFEPAGIAAILRSHGFCAIEDINFQEIASRFGRAIQGLGPGHLGVHVVHAKQELLLRRL